MSLSFANIDPWYICTTDHHRDPSKRAKHDLGCSFPSTRNYEWFRLGNLFFEERDVDVINGVVYAKEEPPTRNSTHPIPLFSFGNCFPNPHFPADVFLPNERFPPDVSSEVLWQTMGFPTNPFVSVLSGVLADLCFIPLNVPPTDFAGF